LLSMISTSRSFVTICSDPYLFLLTKNPLSNHDLPPINWASEKVRILAESLVREKEVLP